MRIPRIALTIGEFSIITLNPSYFQTNCQLHLMRKVISTSKRESFNRIFFRDERMYEKMRTFMEITKNEFIDHVVILVPAFEQTLQKSTVFTTENTSENYY